MADTDYRITREECERQHAGNVCPRCGAPIGAIETVDNAGNPTHWAGCLICMRFNSGVYQRVFDLAVVLYDEIRVRPWIYRDDVMSEDSIKLEQMDKLCQMVVSVEAAQKFEM